MKSMAKADNKTHEVLYMFLSENFISVIVYIVSKNKKISKLFSQKCLLK